ncbi:hypothetical protein CF326_g6582 [Tilletia indica]|nr:hypothetical protein CF326_g6582 [Tilletia indica]
MSQASPYPMSSSPLPVRSRPGMDFETHSTLGFGPFPSQHDRFSGGHFGSTAWSNPQNGQFSGGEPSGSTAWSNPQHDRFSGGGPSGSTAWSNPQHGQFSRGGPSGSTAWSNPQHDRFSGAGPSGSTVWSNPNLNPSAGRSFFASQERWDTSRDAHHTGSADRFAAHQGNESNEKDTSGSRISDARAVATTHLAAEADGHASSTTDGL